MQHACSMLARLSRCTAGVHTRSLPSLPCQLNPRECSGKRAYSLASKCCEVVLAGIVLSMYFSNRTCLSRVFVPHRAKNVYAVANRTAIRAVADAMSKKHIAIRQNKYDACTFHVLSDDGRTEEDWKVGPRYQLLHYLGSGSFSRVCAARDTATDTVVCIIISLLRAADCTACLCRLFAGRAVCLTQQA